MAISSLAHRLRAALPRMSKRRWVVVVVAATLVMDVGVFVVLPSRLNAGAKMPSAGGPAKQRPPDPSPAAAARQARNKTASATVVRHGVVNATDPNCYVPYEFARQHDYRCAPHFFVIGALKSGTTSLYRYLSLHPDVAVYGAPFRDTRTWVDPDSDLLLKIKESQTFGNPASTHDSIVQYFPRIEPGERIVTGDATPSYISAPAVPLNILKIQPNGRFVLLMREPVERIASRIKHLATLKGFNTSDAALVHYAEEFIGAQFEGTESCLESFEPDAYPSYISAYNQLHSCLKKATAGVAELSPRQLQRQWAVDHGEVGMPAEEGPAPVKHSAFFRKAGRVAVMMVSLYYWQILNWLEYFPREQLLIMKAEDFYADTSAAMNKITEFIGLAPFDWTEVVSVKYNVQKKEKGRGHVLAPEKNAITVHHMRPETRKKLQDFYRPYNKLLGELLGEEMWTYDEEGED